MARQINLFAFTGKLGDVVGYHHKGKYYLRRLPVRKNKNLSPAQMAHKQKFAIASKFVRCLSPLLAVSIADHKKMTRSNYILSHTMKQAMHGAYPDFHINYSQVLISHGNLQRAMTESAEILAGNIYFTWRNDSRFGNARDDDKAILVVYCETLNQCIYSFNETCRHTGNALLPVLPFKGHQVQTWMGFISCNGKLRSNSIYTGQMFVT